MDILDHKVRILDKKSLTHNVIRWRLEKPEGYSYTAGQGIGLIADKDGYRDKDQRPFTFTSLNSDDYLELMTKIYPDHNGVTEGMSTLNVDDHFFISDPWDTYEYKGDGLFIAGGAGVTPFVAILRDQAAKNNADGNKLILANKTSDDIFPQEELNSILYNNFINILSDEDDTDHIHGRIDRDFIEKHMESQNGPFYTCGPEGFSESMKDYLVDLGVDESNIYMEY